MASKLREYERKRDPERTPEPFSNSRTKVGRPRFVVQRHHARSLHYDFRLERDGVLASWAVPKGVPMEPGQRHLAVHVEDHPLDYARFEAGASSLFLTSNQFFSSPESLAGTRVQSPSSRSPWR